MGVLYDVDGGEDGMSEPYRSNFQRLCVFTDEEVRSTIKLLKEMGKCNSRDNTIEKLKDILRYRHVKRTYKTDIEQAEKHLEKFHDGLIGGMGHRELIDELGSVVGHLTRSIKKGRESRSGRTRC